MIKSDYNTDWQINRIKFIESKFNITNKTILELGAFNGDIGNYFQNKGNTVTCVEGREENYLNMINKYPNLIHKMSNLDTNYWEFGKYDIIINFGLIYHFEKYHRIHIENCIKNCNFLFLESVVYDSKKAEIYYREEEGIDQSLSNIGGTPSSKYLENIFNEMKVKWKRYDNTDLNSGSHIYDWKEKNSKIFDGYKRRFYIIENEI